MESYDLKDEFTFEDYYLWEYEENNGPPLIKKTSRLIASVVNNQVEVLRDLLDSPKWYNVRDNEDNRLIEIAILADRPEVFDYMITLPGFLDQYGEIALKRALNEFNGRPLGEYFAHELILKGVNYNICFEFGNNALHEAIGREFANVAKLLIEQGVDVNGVDSDGCAPLELVQYIESDEKKMEVAVALLVHGAEPSFNLNFCSSVLRKDLLEFQEILFLYTCDLFLQCELEFEVVLRLAHSDSWMFHEILKYPLEISVGEHAAAAFDYFYLLCSMKIDYLRIIVEKFSSLLIEVFQRTDTLHHSTPCRIILDLHFDNLNLLFESIPIDFIGKMHTHDLFFRLVCNGYKENKITELYCFFLSYGATPNEKDLHFVYDRFGFCDLFKILLHMDFQKGYDIAPTIPRFIYDPTLALERLIQSVVSEKNRNATRWDVYQLLHYFADQRLINLYNDFEKERCYEKKLESLPQLPCLVELARNKFREYFIGKYDIQTSRKFFTLLKCLPISKVHEKIISYETKLYN